MLFRSVAEGERPFFPRVWFQADAQTGIIGMSDLIKPGRTPGGLQEDFLAMLEDYGVLPAEIRTTSAESLALLAPIAHLLGLRLRLVPRTPELARARAALAAAFLHPDSMSLAGGLFD